MFTRFRRIGAIMAASAVMLATFAQPAMAASIPLGAYSIGRQLYGDQRWILTVTTAVATRDEFTINIVYQNVSSQEQKLFCPTDRQALYVHGTRRIETLRTYCSAREGQEWSVQPGGIVASFGVFPNGPDLTTPFDLSWYNWGTARGITLQKDPMSSSKFQELLTDLNSLQASTLCVSSVTGATSLYGYPVGTLFGLVNPECAETVQEGVKQGIALYECINRYPNQALLCFGVATEAKGRLTTVSTSSGETKDGEWPGHFAVGPAGGFGDVGAAGQA